jgi:hypothetical protein
MAPHREHGQPADLRRLLSRRFLRKRRMRGRRANVLATMPFVTFSTTLKEGRGSRDESTLLTALGKGRRRLRRERKGRAWGGGGGERCSRLVTLSP